MNNYPPGVTGNGYAIAGPDYEKEWEEYPCPKCGEGLYEVGHRGDRWLSCSCGWERDLEPNEPDADRAYDEERDRQMCEDNQSDG